MDDQSAMGTHALRVVPSQQHTGTMESPDYVSHGRDATVSGRSVRGGTNEGTPDHRSAMGTHDLRVVPSQQPQNSRNEHRTTCKCVILNSSRAGRGHNALTQPSNPFGVTSSSHCAKGKPSGIAPCVRIQRRFARFGGWSLTVQHLNMSGSVNCGGSVSSLSLTTIKLRGRLTEQVRA